MWGDHIMRDYMDKQFWPCLELPIGIAWNLFTPRPHYGSIIIFVWTKFYGVTIQMKPLQQYFHMVLFV